jgi:hypothetical protein
LSKKPLVRRRVAEKHQAVAARRNHLFVGALRTQLQTTTALELARTTPRDNVDNAANRIRTVKRALRAAHNFNALDVLDGHGAKVETAIGGRVGTHTIQQNQSLVRVAAAQENRSGFACVPLCEIETPGASRIASTKSNGFFSSIWRRVTTVTAEVVCASVRCVRVAVTTTMVSSAAGVGVASEVGVGDASGVGVGSD